MLLWILWTHYVWSTFNYNFNSRKRIRMFVQFFTHISKNFMVNISSTALVYHHWFLINQDFGLGFQFHLRLTLVNLTRVTKFKWFKTHTKCVGNSLNNSSSLCWRLTSGSLRFLMHLAQFTYCSKNNIQIVPLWNFSSLLATCQKYLPMERINMFFQTFDH